ncbi:hypothetical protein ScPMuIL_004233 [Solemya velum]
MFLENKSDLKTTKNKTMIRKNGTPVGESMSDVIRNMSKTLAKKTAEDQNEKLLLEPFRYICQVPGKKIRTKLVAACNYWLDVPVDKLICIGEITQMLHNASLLIDDIEDNSQLRRGIPVAHLIYGNAHTINCANYVYFLGLEKVLKLNKPEGARIFAEEGVEIHIGQGMDIYWRESVVCPTVDEYKEMVIRKTGGVFRAAVRLMQCISDFDKDLMPLVETLGCYFQIRDDYANLVSKEYEANKTYCEDLTEGKFSFPIIHAIRKKPEDTRILHIVKERPTDYATKKSCVDMMTELGSFEYTKEVLCDLEEKLLNIIKDLGGNPFLTQLIDDLALIYKEEC